MILSRNHKFAFVKTRKTAGSTLEKLVYPYLDKRYDMCTGSPRDETPRLNTEITNGHQDWRYFDTNHSVEWRDYFKFSIERNPWDKVVSSYFWHQEIKPQMFGQMDFETYIMTCNLLPRDWSMYSYVDKPAVDVVYRYEDMPTMYADLNERFGFEITPKEFEGTKLKSGIRKVADYRDIHTAKTKDAVHAMFANEIKEFGYEF